MRELNGELAAQHRAHGTAAKFFDLDLRFHQSFVDAVVGPRLLTLHRAIKPHEAIASAIARGDADAAQVAAETNWANAASRLAHIIWQHGERGSWVGPREGSAPAPRKLRRRNSA